MKAVIRFLNGVLDTGMAAGVQAEEAREALYKIEHCELAMGALRNLLDHPTNAEAKAHAEKVLASIAWRPKAAPQAAGAATLPIPTVPAPVGAAPVPNSDPKVEDCTDLV